jgi:predicted MPP superfamily phosphohydrolase
MKFDMKEIFTYAPFAALAISFFTFILRAKLRFFPKVLWTLWLLLCFSKFYCFGKFGGHVFYPEFPQAVIILWDVAYSGAVILTLLSILFIFRFRFKAVLLPLIAWTTAAAGVWNGVKIPDVKEVELEFAALPDSLDGYRIAQISDLHCSSAARKWRTEAIVEKVNSLNADLICLTGDYVDGLVADRNVDLLPLKNLTASDGVYYVAGNHEFYRDGVKWKKWYQENGMRFLVNECVFPRPGLVLGGVNDFVARNYRRTPPDVREAFAAATNGEFRILLQHQPKEAAANIKEIGVDLQLSGHTHGGVAPIIRQLVSKHNSGFSRGVYRYGKGVLYVSPGAGQWAGFPIRFCNPSEVALFKLVKGKKTGDGGN